MAAEVVTADAFQVYCGLDIGTAKPTAVERGGIPHHLIDIVDPRTGKSIEVVSGTSDHRRSSMPAQVYEPFTVDRWLSRAEATITDLRSRGVLPIVVGGTHLYVKALLDGLFDGPEPDAALRAKLTSMDADARRAELERVDPEAAARIHPNDIRRTVRALEVYRLTGIPISAQQTQWKPEAQTSLPAFTLIGIDWPTELINQRINARVKGMIERGLVEEVRELLASGALGPQAREALGYKQLLHHLNAQVTLEDAIEAIKIETRRFAKNQRTWLRQLRVRPGAIWIAAAERPLLQWADEFFNSF